MVIVGDGTRDITSGREDTFYGSREKSGDGEVFLVPWKATESLMLLLVGV